MISLRVLALYLSFFQGITGDVRLISAIDAPSYARRFVRFMNENID